MEPVPESNFWTKSCLLASRVNNLAGIVVAAAIFAKYGKATPANPENCPNAALMATVYGLFSSFFASS